MYHVQGRILRRKGELRMTRFHHEVTSTVMAIVAILGLLSMACQAPANTAPSEAQWQRIPLDLTESTLGKLATAFSRASRDDRHSRSIDRCMISWALRPPAKTDPPAFEARLEWRIEGTGGAAVVDSASVYSSNFKDTRVTSCLARAFEGPIEVALPQGKRLRFLFPVSLHRRSLAFYRAKYPAPHPQPRD